VFWMWVTGLIGMATSFSECTIAQVFKTAEGDGSYRADPLITSNGGLTCGGWVCSFPSCY
jgi:AGCS family alanine or glycine:cation symporter